MKVVGIVVGVAAVAAVVAIAVYKRQEVSEFANHEYEHLQKQIHDLDMRIHASSKESTASGNAG